MLDFLAQMLLHTVALVCRTLCVCACFVDTYFFPHCCIVPSAVQCSGGDWWTVLRTWYCSCTVYSLWCQGFSSRWVSVAVDTKNFASFGGPSQEHRELIDSFPSSPSLTYLGCPWDFFSWVFFLLFVGQPQLAHNKEMVGGSGAALVTGWLAGQDVAVQSGWINMHTVDTYVRATSATRPPWFVVHGSLLRLGIGIACF